MKHIDGDAFARRCEEKAEEMSTTIGKAVFLAIARAVEETPESVVRCKDCAWYENVHLKCDGTVDKRYTRSVCVKGTFAKVRKADWFCADGERREDGKAD